MDKIKWKKKWEVDNQHSTENGCKLVKMMGKTAYLSTTLNIAWCLCVCMRKKERINEWKHKKVEKNQRRRLHFENYPRNEPEWIVIETTAQKKKNKLAPTTRRNRFVQRIHLSCVQRVCVWQNGKFRTNETKYF